MTTTTERGSEVGASADLVHEVTQFLYAEAEILDQWKLYEWLELFAADGSYLVPTTDRPDGDPAQDLFLIQDDRFLLEQRVNSLQTRAAHAEYPHSRTRRTVTNVRVFEQADGTLKVFANFIVHRVRAGNVVAYVGQYHHLLVRDDEDLRFRVRKAVLDLDTLRPQGKISIIL